MNRDEAVDKAITKFLDNEDGNRAQRLEYIEALADLAEVAIRRLNAAQIRAVVDQIEARQDGPSKLNRPLAIAAMVLMERRLSMRILNRAQALPADVADPMPGVSYTPPQRPARIRIP